MATTTTGLTEETRNIIKATVPVLEEHGEQITTRFYQLMFENHPELKNIFNQTNQRHGDQPRALANTVYAAAANIDNLEAILPAVDSIAHKHKSLNIKPEHYPIVGKYLLLGIKDVLGDAATDEIIDAWEKAYGVIADVFISVEKEMYEETKKMTGGWIDYRDFKVMKKVKESNVITSFYLEPADGNPFPGYKAGQYITVKVDIEGEPYTHQRQYSLSCAPDEGMYRISVKREDGTADIPAGIVSSYLHEHVEEGNMLSISAPSGEFYLDTEDTRPLVLLSGGVGLTPMMSMLETVIKEQPERKVTYIHAAQNGNVHAMKDRVNEITESHNNVNSYVVYDRPETDDQYDKLGHIDTEWLSTILPTTDAAYYFCGPKGFMRAAYKILKEYGVAEEDIHFEIFGPAEDITN
ncbi:NO-inducible flavohemoprotein [Oceanobacillus alkalisoli]|uniref:NO-inducible flavohemoprotein n=1 Tax=Oceanobacillus alkalisoli TaxID=2925113 RepID=UPI001EF035C3|nr:NO-inducible flavohemoprotein [Oceanobacillus alkalisoli]MCF3944774.1 NO-inducible flavohemoprotein [Oceanobacillus alkalisoli]MCG5105266.1 NO-inducible flavohemoprotein [Oceanobacillus alkalisoli]